MKRVYSLKSAAGLVALVGTTALAVGCAPKNTTASQVTASFKMTGSSSAATVAQSKRPSIFDILISTAKALVPSSILDSAGSTVTLSSAWVVVKEIEFKSSETAGNSEDDQESEVEFKGPYFVDLLSSAAVTLDTQSITAKSIKRVKMNLEATHATLPAGAPAGLAGNSIYVVGAVGSNAFTFKLDDETELDVAGPNGFVPSANSDILVEVKIADIFKQINLSSVTNNEVISHTSRHAGANLCPAISASANDLYTCFRKGLEMHADAALDDNHDNKIESFESHVK